ADRSVYYGAGGSKIASFAARTRQPDGTTVEVPEDLRRDTLLFKDDKQEHRVRQFTFPGAGVGSVLEWEYQIDYLEPRRWLWWEVQRRIPVLEERFHTRAKKPSKEDVAVGHYSRTDVSPWCQSV